MNSVERRSDDPGGKRAVSPVIGVILMVAITVILAAVIATFVLGLGDQVSQTTPNANFGYEFDADANTVVITHEGGAPIEIDRLSVVRSESGTIPSGSTGWAGTVNAGDSTNKLPYAAGEHIRVVWTSEGSDRSKTLANHQAPS